MVSKVIISDYAQQQLDSYVLYVLLEKGNPQAAKNITRDALLTRDRLLNIADSLRLMDIPIKRPNEIRQYFKTAIFSSHWFLCSG